MLDDLNLVDSDGDHLEVEDYDTYVAITAECHDDGDVAEVHLDPTAAENLHRWLGEWLGDTSPDCAEDRPDATADGYDWPTEAPSVALEAHHAVYGDRQDDYGHPRADFNRAAVLWTGLLQHKLAEGEFITAEDIGRCLIGVKLARDVHAPKRDNRVDMAGYAITLDRLETGH